MSQLNMFPTKKRDISQAGKAGCRTYVHIVGRLRLGFDLCMTVTSTLQKPYEAKVGWGYI